jgi:probable HAF family extracellular repeat protein
MSAFTYATLNVPSALGATDTYAYGINDSGQIVGYYDGSQEYGFVYNDGIYTTLNDPLAIRATVAYGINASGQIVGYYNDNLLHNHGFVYSNGTYTTLDDPLSNGGTGTVASGINASGEIVGSYTTSAGGTYGFVYSSGTYTALLRVPSGINASGQIVGSFTDNHGNHDGFLYSNGTYTTLNDPLGTGGTYASGINDSGQIVGSYIDSNGNAHGFVDNGGTYTTLDDPLAANGTGTGASGINDSGEIVGIYQNPAFVVHGFVYGNLSVFTSGSDTVDFNNLTDNQKALIAEGSDKFHGLGGSDTVTLPNEAKYNQVIGTDQSGKNIALGWTDTAASTFYTGSLTGDTYQVTGGDGSYFIVAGAGSDIIDITGKGNSTITTGSGNANITITGDGNNTVTTGSGDANITIDGYGNNTITAGSGHDTVSITGDTLLGGNTIHGGVNLVTFSSISVDSTNLTMDGLSSVASFNMVDGDTTILNGSLDITGDVTGSGTITIGANSTLELGKNDSAGVYFDGVGTLILDQPQLFNGSITGQTNGDQIILKNTNYSVVAVTFGQDNNGEELKISEGIDAVHVTKTLYLQNTITNAATLISGHYFGVTLSANLEDTILTFKQGNPIDVAVNGPQARQIAGNGSGIKIGIISDSFNALNGYSTDVLLNSLPAGIEILSDATGTDTGRAMAQVIHAIAPGAGIDFATGLAGGQKGIAAAIADLALDGCQIIVDNLYSSAEPNWGGAINDAIDAAAQLGVTYVTSAGDFADIAKPIFGSKLNANAITVGAINWLAIGGYLPQVPESFSSLGSAGKPDVVAPDGAPTTVGLSGLNAFFGTAAAAPVVAAVAALMMSANGQLKNNPSEIHALIDQTALPFNDPSATGHGLVQAPAAVQAALSVASPFFKAPSQQTSSPSDTQVDLISGAQAGPTVASALTSQPGGNVKTGSTIQFILSMTEGTTVAGGTPIFKLNDGATASFDSSASNPTAGSLVFDYTIGANDHGSNLALTGFNLSGATVKDTAGASADFSALFNLPTGLSINSPLLVTTVASSQTGEAHAGQTVQLTMTLNEPVTVTTSGGLPTLSLNDNATATYDSTASNLAAGQLVFDYTVGANDATPNLSIFQVHLPNGSTVQDGGKNNAEFSAALNQNTGLQVGPAFVNVFYASQTGAAHSGQTVQLTILMSAAVTVNLSGGSPTLSLNDGATASYDAQASNPATGMLVFDYTVGSKDQTPDLLVTQVNPNGAIIHDGNGVNVDTSGALNFPTFLSINSPLVVTTVAASQTGQVLAGQTVQLTLTLNESVQDNSVDNMYGPPTLTLNDGATATFDAVASNLSAGKIVFDYTVGAGEHTPNLAITQVNLNGEDIADANGNLPDFSAALNVSTNLQVGSSLYVTAVTPSQTTEADAGKTVKLTLSMSEGLSITGGSLSLTLNDGATATFDAAASKLATGTLVFDYTVGATDHMSNLEITQVNLNGAIAHDSNGQNTDFTGALNIGTGLQIGPLPTVLSISATTDNHTAVVNAGHVVTVTMTTSEAVTVTGTPTLQLNDNEVAAYTFGSGSKTLSFSYVAQTGDNVADLHVTGLNLPTGASILDGNGSSLAGSVTSDLGIQVDTVTVPLTSVQQQILGLYGVLYDRAADFGGLSYWTGVVGQQPDGAGVTVANGASTAITTNDATVLGQLFVSTESSYFNQVYGAMSDSAFITTLYGTIGGNTIGIAPGITYWSGVLQAAEAAGQSQQAARAGIVGEIVQAMIDYNINIRAAGYTDAEWLAAQQRQETTDNKVAVSLAYSNASQQPGGTILDAVTVTDAAFQAATRVIEGVTYNGTTADAAISHILYAVALQDLTQIQPIGVVSGGLMG